MVALLAPSPVPPVADAPRSVRSEPRLPAEVRRHGTVLLNQQFWLWGQDIRRPEGNALLLRGFVQERPPADLRGSTRYELALGSDRVVVLWGFGLFYGDRELGGLYLGRFRLAPRLCPQDTPRGVWEPSRLPRIVPPADADDRRRAGALLVAALRWVAAYEAWASDALGAEHRRRSVDAWRRPACRPEEIVAAWTRLAHRCHASAVRADRRRTPVPALEPPPVAQETPRAATANKHDRNRSPAARRNKL